MNTFEKMLIIVVCSFLLGFTLTIIYLNNNIDEIKAKQELDLKEKSSCWYYNEIQLYNVGNFTRCTHTAIIVQDNKILKLPSTHPYVLEQDKKRFNGTLG